jgi:hypothetical protein
VNYDVDKFEDKDYDSDSDEEDSDNSEDDDDDDDDKDMYDKMDPDTITALRDPLLYKMMKIVKNPMTNSSRRAGPRT